MYLLEVFRLSYPDVRQFNAAVTNEGSLKPKNFCTVLSTYGLISSMSFFERLDAIISYTSLHLKIQINIDNMKIFVNGVSYRRKLQCPKHIGRAIRHSVLTEWARSIHQLTPIYIRIAFSDSRNTAIRQSQPSVITRYSFVSRNSFHWHILVFLCIQWIWRLQPITGTTH
jgi:hypothetical protein